MRMLIVLVYVTITVTQDSIIKTTKPFDSESKSSLKSRIEFLSNVFRQRLDSLKDGDHKQVELIFLLDGSSSIGEENFGSELKFIRKLIADFIIGPNATRVAIVVFSSNAVTHVNHLDGEQNNEKCSLLHMEMPLIEYVGGNTFTLGAMEEAQLILNQSRPEAKKALFLVTDGFSNNGDPIPVAATLKRSGVKIFTFGIKSGNVEELYKLSSPPIEEHCFLFESFSEFEALARRALHQDLGVGVGTPVEDITLCSNLCNQTDKICCNPNSTCSCGTLSGYFSCLCPPGHYGSGLINDKCFPCPKGTYNDGAVPGDISVCRQCPDGNLNTKQYPATSINDCICNDGFVPVGDKCEVVTCPELKSPKNGYFVKQNCSNVLNAACGVRCAIGYELTGSSVRICQKNASWTGVEPYCKPKKCPGLKPVRYGEILCTHEKEGFEILINYGENSEKLKEIVKRKPLNEKHVNALNESFIVDTECRFGCPVGFSLVGSKLRTCLPVTRWDGLQATCKPITCSSIGKITHGQIIPENCTKTGIKHGFGAKCHVSCNSGFILKGNSSRHCTGKYGTWSGKSHPYKCLDTEPPKLECPQNMTVPTDDGAQFATINFTFPPVIDNSGVEPILWTKPSLSDIKTAQLGIGDNQIQILATDASGNLASCFFWIFVNDTEYPAVESCESPAPMSLAQVLQVKWEEPVFWDNSGFMNIERSHEMNGLTNGTTIITYTASDLTGNEAICKINITLLDNVCTIPPTHENADVTCSSSDNETVCELFCKPGFSSEAPNATLTCRQAQWIINSSNNESSFPDCSEIVPAEEVVEKGQFTVEGDELDCESETVNEIKNEIAKNINGEDFQVKLECEKEEEEELSNIIFNGISKRRKRYTKRVRKFNFSIKSAPKYESKYNEPTSHVEDFKTILNNNKGLQVVSYEANEKLIICGEGSILINSICVKCPVGTSYNSSDKSCTSCPVGYYQNKEGQIACLKCPAQSSTLYLRTTHVTDCRSICPVGSIGTRINPIGLALYPCRRCPIGQYQPVPGRLKCLDCAQSVMARNEPVCYKYQTCTSSTCKNNGTCFPDPVTCICTEGYLGSFCEKHFLPCDSSPCHNGATCQNVDHSSFSCKCSDGYDGKLCQYERDACLKSPCGGNGVCHPTFKGYYCDCYQGFQGTNCSETIDTCKIATPCANNSTCKSLSDGSFSCICGQSYSGRYCERYNGCLPEEEWFCKLVENKTDPCDNQKCYSGSVCQLIDSEAVCIGEKESNRETDKNIVLTFPKCSSTDYMMIDLQTSKLKEVSVCLWVQTADNLNFGTLFSYATKNNDNELTLTDYNGFVLYVLGERVVTDVVANDGFWHMVCFSWKSDGGEWKIYLDGILTANGTNLANGRNIRGIGKLVVGQEQDRLGGGFNEAESFVGKLTQVEMWSKLLTDIEINNLFNKCDDELYKSSNNIFEKLLKNIKGNVKISTSTFCKPCGDPPSLFRSEVKSMENEAIYQCLPGFLMKFPNEPIQSSVSNWTRKCLKTGKWEEIAPTCTRITCGLPGYLLHGSIIGRSHLFEYSVQYVCHHGYLLMGPSERVCQADGQWSNTKPFCKSIQDLGDCPLPVAPRRGSLFFMSGRTRNISIGDQVEFTCDAGYYIIGSGVLTCMSNGAWNHREPACSLCPTPKILPIVTVTTGENPEQINLYCPLSGESITVTCNIGMWNISSNFCRSSNVPCSTPKAPNHGYFLSHTRDLSSKYVGEVVHFGCRHGYNLEGTNYIVCLSDQTWNSSSTACVPVRCSKPEAPENAFSTKSNASYVYGDLVTFQCNPGYQISSPTAIRCEAEGKWSRSYTKCLKIP